jgi:TDG/mug DNA glycosylase family protein
VGHHFAGPSNRFWQLLHESGLVTDRLTYHDDWRLPQWGLGLTNIISRSSAGIDALRPDEYRAGAVQLRKKVYRYRPLIVAFLGVTTFRMIFQQQVSASPLLLGLQPVRLAETPVFLLPNPSRRNAHYSYECMLTAFRALYETTRQADSRGNRDK